MDRAQPLINIPCWLLRGKSNAEEHTGKARILRDRAGKMVNTVNSIFGSRPPLVLALY
jgi:hypothetical protein